MKNVEAINQKKIVFVDSHGYIEKFKVILEEVGNGRLVGETGTGKTTLVHALTEQLDAELYEIVLTRDITKWDLLASDILKAGATQTREGIILKWLNSKSDKIKILYLDGFNYAEPSILSLIESLADFRGNVWIPELEMTLKRTDKHYLVISYNPSEKIGYSGTFLENIATIRRFEGLVIDYIDRKDEIDLIKSYTNDYDFSVKFVEIARKTRELYRKSKLKTPLTTGNLINYAKMKKSLSEEDLIEIASSLYPEDERPTFKRLFEEKGDIDLEKLKEEEKKEED